MPMIDALVAEMEQEAASTRRLFERLPDDKMDFKPHEKSYSLAQLSGHLAEMFQWAGAVFGSDEFVWEEGEYEPFIPDSAAAALTKLDESAATFKQAAEGVSDEALGETWVMRTPETVIMELPRIAAVRTTILNHFVHHRGQLTVYLRLLDVPLPPIYGPTADEQAPMG